MLRPLPTSTSVPTPPAPPAPAYTPWTDRSLPPDARLARVAADVTARLRGVCAHLPPDAFDALVADIVRTKLRWAEAAFPEVPR